MKILFFVTVASPVRWVGIKTESVEMIPFINLKVVERPMTTTNDTMPHTWIVWGVCTKVHSHIATQEMSAVRRPVVKKTSTFSD